MLDRKVLANGIAVDGMRLRDEVLAALDVPRRKDGARIAIFGSNGVLHRIDLACYRRLQRGGRRSDKLLDARGRAGHAICQPIIRPRLEAEQMREPVADRDRLLEQRYVRGGRAIVEGHVVGAPRVFAGRLGQEFVRAAIDRNGIAAVRARESRQHVAAEAVGLPRREFDRRRVVGQVLSEAIFQIVKRRFEFDELGAPRRSQLGAGAMQRFEPQIGELLIVDRLRGAGRRGELYRGVETREARSAR